MKMRTSAILTIIMAAMLCSRAYACPDGGSAPCRPGDHFSYESGIGPSFVSSFAAPELDPSAGIAGIILLLGTLAVIRGKRK